MKKCHSFLVLSIAVCTSAAGAYSASASAPLQAPRAPEALNRFLNRAAIRAKALSEAEVRGFFEVTDAKGNLIRLQTQNDPSRNWALLDPSTDKIEGTSTERAYQELSLKAQGKPVIVAVIDSGVDIEHEDLRGRLWVNEREKLGKPGVDDDGNGYVDDVNGWNFLGRADGTNVIGTNLEMTRELVRLTKKKQTTGLTDAETTYLAEIEKAYSAEREEAEAAVAQYSRIREEYSTALTLLMQAGLREETRAAVEAFRAPTDTLRQARTVVLGYLRNGIDSARIKRVLDHYQSTLDNHLNKDADPSKIIGDDPENLSEIGYGNPDVKTETADHGTHVAGIIAAVRKNGLGMDGQAHHVKIMAIRAVPDGDERDKDVANAVRYAVDNGAQIINMSFGKGYSPHKAHVDAAFRYADAKGVLVVHAAGNSSLNIDVAPNFPNRKTLRVDNWLEVGASGPAKGLSLPARFSNYGRNSVDLFAPGVNIYSTVPGSKYASFSGTSMASPEVAGVAALILSQQPNLTASEIRNLILSNVRRYDGSRVALPGTGELVEFSSLSITGGIVDAFASLKALFQLR